MRQPIADMSPVEQADFARDIVVRRLTDRARSRADLAQTLAKKQVPDEIAEAMLDKFAAAGLINDAEFAHAWVGARQRGKGLARNALTMELRRHGIDEEIAKEALAQIDPEVERESAHELVRKKLKAMSGLDRHVQTRRLVGMLARKGYAGQLAFEVVRDELQLEAESLDSR